MATLNNTQISTTYLGLLKTSDNGDLTGNTDASAVNVTDGVGTATNLYISTNRVGIGDSTPTSILSVQTTSLPQLALKYDNSNTASLSVTSGGILQLDSSGGEVKILDTVRLTGYSGGTGGGIINATGQAILSFSGVNQELVLGGAVTSPATVKGEGLNISDDAIFSATTGSFGSNGNGYELFLYSDTSNRYVQWVDANARLQFKDNTELTLGDGNDLTVVHNGSKTTITNTTGDLDIDTGTSDLDIKAGHIFLETANGDSKGFEFREAGGAEKGGMRLVDSAVSEAGDILELGTVSDLNTLRIRDGRIGIKTGTPTATLHINGTTKFSGPIMVEKDSVEISGGVLNITSTQGPYIAAIAQQGVGSDDADTITHIKVDGNEPTIGTIIYLTRSHNDVITLTLGGSAASTIVGYWADDVDETVQAGVTAVLDGAYVFAQLIYTEANRWSIMNPGACKMTV
tara:strand:- start:13449 stop:14825 length:1377 start_codon:yes stop_codon:yes gene_type:complete